MHYSVGAVIKDKNKFLLIERSNPPLGYAGVAGHVDKGEEFTEALKREVKEESGLEVQKYELIYEEELNWNWCSLGVETHYWHLYRCKTSGTLNRDKEETESIDWYSPSEIKRLYKKDKVEEVWEYWFKKLEVIQD